MKEAAIMAFGAILDGNSFISLLFFFSSLLLLASKSLYLSSALLIFSPSHIFGRLEEV
jgi:hypothetical protein